MHYSTLFNMAENQHFLIISVFLATISKAFQLVFLNTLALVTYFTI